MLLTFRGGTVAKDSTLQVGQAPPVTLSVGSSLMVADTGAQGTDALLANARLGLNSGTRQCNPYILRRLHQLATTEVEARMTVWRLLPTAATSVILSR